MNSANIDISRFRRVDFVYRLHIGSGQPLKAYRIAFARTLLSPGSGAASRPLSYL
ncbi:hypothetical protein LZ32DRAFT_609983 [Colletotrichum eremochloae]|nr:hypothetical protein LZ32DRAFT_609983 [Colletotrichum eremochloae]